MRVSCVCVLSMAMAFVANAAAFAQDNPYGGGTRFTAPPAAAIPHGALSDLDKARIVTERFAACEIKAHRASVLKAIQVEPWDANAQKMLLGVVDSNCLSSGELQMPANLLRGVFYQQLYREKFGASVPTLPDKPLQIEAPATAEMGDDQKIAVAMQQFGDCLVRSDPQDSHALVLATPGSAEETAAVQALSPHFSPCVTQGATWTLNRSALSAIVSEVLYREASSVVSEKGAS